MEFLKKFFLDGIIPFSQFLQKGLLILSILSFVIIGFFPHFYRDMGSLGWALFLGILFLSPLVRIFPEFKIFRSLLPFRKEAGIFCGCLLICHGIGFFLFYNFALKDIFLPDFWNPKFLYFWGILGVLALIPLVLTSNIFSMRLLRQWWKKLHMLVYFVLVVGALHIILIPLSRGEDFFSVFFSTLETLLPIFVFFILKALAWKGVQFRFFKKQHLINNFLKEK